jgi:hypothetical protein
MKFFFLTGLLISISAMAEIKERYEIKINQSLSHPHNSYYIHIQDGKVVSENDLNKQRDYCQARLGFGETVSSNAPAFIFDPPAIFGTDEGNFRHMFLNHDFQAKLRSIDCYLSVEDVSIEMMNQVLGPIAQVSLSQQVLKEDLDNKKLRSACEHKVIDYYSGIYHRTYKAASNTFLNNFVGRKNTFAHVWGAPKVAFLQLSFTVNNYIADRIVEKSKKSKEEVYEKYITLLRTGKLCEEMKQDYKKPRKVRKYLLNKLKQS